jgi:hypothetical protein
MAGIFLSDACDDKDFDFLNNVASDFFGDESTEVGIEASFKLSDMLNRPIELNELINVRNEQILDIESKPLFDKTRAELLKIIEKIDSLKFQDPNNLTYL